MPVACAQCAASFSDGADSCTTRFEQLLALDHSRREPWGSRHGLAFSVFALQHPDGRPATMLDRCWSMLHRVVERGEDPSVVARSLRASHHQPDAVVPELRSVPPRQFRMTIVDLGDFDAAAYPAQLDGWCRATLAAWRGQQA